MGNLLEEFLKKKKYQEILCTSWILQILSGNKKNNTLLNNAILGYQVLSELRMDVQMSDWILMRPIYGYIVYLIA